MTAGIIRLIVERVYFQDSIEHLGSCRVFDISDKEPELADRIEADMKGQGWQVHREHL